MIRLAVIGLNHGLSHIKNIKLLRDKATLVGICATTSNINREQLADEYQARFYLDYKEMIKDLTPDGIIVCSPHYLHLELVEFCSTYRIALLLEKPISDTVENANKIASIIEKSGLKVLVGYHRRFSPKVRMLKDIIDNGSIGIPLGASIIWAILKPEDYFRNEKSDKWQRFRKYGGGPVMINASHEIDTLRYIFGTISEIVGVSNNSLRRFDVEDTASISIKFNSGVVASIFLTDCCPSTLSYENTSGENPFYYHYNDNCAYYFGSKGSLSFPSFELSQHLDEKGWQKPIIKTRVPFSISSQDPLLLELEHFCDVISNNVEPLINVSDSIETLKAVESITLITKYNSLD